MEVFFGTRGPLKRVKKGPIYSLNKLGPIFEVHFNKLFAKLISLHN
jgi:hypothetical protein